MKSACFPWGSTRDRRTHAGLAIALTLAVVLLVAASGQASAQVPYPNKPIRIIVPYPPGSGPDFTAREIGQQYSKALGQPMVIDNRSGAAATMGHALAAKSPPDGYTLLPGTTGGLVSGPALVGSRIPYDPFKDFATIGLATYVPYGLAAPDVIQRFEKNGLEVATTTPQGLRDMMVTDLQMWKKLIKDAKISVDVLP